jgi:hypothetical protein
LEPSVSTTDTEYWTSIPWHCQINPNGWHSKTKTFVFKVERISYIQISKQVHKLENKIFLFNFVLYYYIW